MADCVAHGSQAPWSCAPVRLLKVPLAHRTACPPEHLEEDVEWEMKRAAGGGVR